jgi:type IV secretory pathway VirB3-like protein
VQPHHPQRQGQVLFQQVTRPYCQIGWCLQNQLLLPHSLLLVMLHHQMILLLLVLLLLHHYGPLVCLTC